MELPLEDGTSWEPSSFPSTSNFVAVENILLKFSDLAVGGGYTVDSVEVSGCETLRRGCAGPIVDKDHG